MHAMPKFAGKETGDNKIIDDEYDVIAWSLVNDQDGQTATFASSIQTRTK